MATNYDTFKSKAEDAADKIAAATPPQVAEVADHLRHEANVQIDRLSETIRKQPIQSAAIAAGLGFLFAMIARR